MTNPLASKHSLVMALAVGSGALLWLCHPTFGNDLHSRVHGGWMHELSTRRIAPKLDSNQDPLTFCDPSESDPAPTRICGWKLFDFYFNRRDTPLWRDSSVWQQDNEKWYTKCSMNPELSQYCSDPAMSNSLSQTPLNMRQLQSSKGGKGSASPDPPLPTVYYNASAAKTIQDDGLGSGQALQNLIATATKSPASIPPFGPDAVVVKEIWEALPITKSAHDAAKLTRLGVYDSRYYDSAALLKGLGNLHSWRVQVPILVDSQGIPNKQQPCDPKVYGVKNDRPPKDERVPISCFFYKDFTAGGQPCTATAQGGQFAPIPLPEPEDGSENLPCFAVLVGFQIATHAINTWTWSTFWWENDALNDETYHDPNAYITVDPRYSHYVMNTTFGPMWDDISTILNPYLEGVSGGSIQQNCYSCHTNAVYVPKSAATPYNEHNTGMDIPVGAAVLPCSLPVADPIKANCPLKTSFLFSIPDNQMEDSQEPPLIMKRLKQNISH